MFVLFSSYDCGMSYQKDCEAETIDELRPKMDELNEAMLRWYIETNGENYTEELCAIHKNTLNFISGLNSENRKQKRQPNKTKPINS